MYGGRPWQETGIIVAKLSLDPPGQTPVVDEAIEEFGRWALDVAAAGQALTAASGDPSSVVPVPLEKSASNPDGVTVAVAAVTGEVRGLNAIMVEHCSFTPGSPRLISALFQLKYDEPLSIFAFDFTSWRYMMCAGGAVAAPAVLEELLAACQAKWGTAGYNAGPPHSPASHLNLSRVSPLTERERCHPSHPTQTYLR
jgi:hypothetical protein